MKEISLFINDTDNLNKLNKVLIIFRAAYNCDPCVVCSHETKNIIPEIELCKTYEDENSHIGMYKGYKVLTDNTLSFGEVKIRQEKRYEDFRYD